MHGQLRQSTRSEANKRTYSEAVAAGVLAISVGDRVTKGGRTGEVLKLRPNGRASVKWDDAKVSNDPHQSGANRAHVLISNLKLLPAGS